MLGLWAVLTLTGALYSAWLGYGGRAFAATLTAFAFFFLVMLLLAARGVENSIASRFGAASGHLLGAAVFLVYLIYALGTNTFAFTRAAAVAGLVFFPLALAASAKQKSPGAWQDFLILAGVCGGKAAAESLGMVAFALALAVPGWASLLRFHRAPLRQHLIGSLPASPPHQQRRLFHWLGTSLEFFHHRELYCLRLHRHSAGPSHALHGICAAVVAIEVAPVSFFGHFLFHRMARRVSLPRSVAKHAFARFE